MTGPVEERLALVAPVIYGDVFDCAVTLDEIWRYAGSRISRAALAHRLSDDAALREVVHESQGFYFLAGRAALAARRPPRQARARTLFERARRVARVLQHAPFVRGLLLTGSVAVDDAGEDADVDLLIVVADGRLASVFALLGGVARVTGHRVFCPNYYVVESHLELTRRDAYVAREIAQARALAGSGDALHAANRWVEALLPNAEPRSAAVPAVTAGAFIQRCLEARFAGALGRRLEAWAGRLAAARLAAHHRDFGTPVPARVAEDLGAGRQLRFHGAPRIAEVPALYEARRAAVAAQLEQLLGVPASASVGAAARAAS